ncbi:hypothetical protein L484_026189 [Morus notabilis]|uniref:Uncharacterized protein n=1 Tax=Morus notabilis TaxID=981085 RepID=W9RGU6_9ROSA|nr:proline-, glutamic acid- and leucine-rich protein 1 [Morus notabilis]EXB74495.1 hypothetical protein L484_026189 [Morus notabilis]
MALRTLALPLVSVPAVSPTSYSSPSSSSPSCFPVTSGSPPSLTLTPFLRRHRPTPPILAHRRFPSHVVRMAPEEEKMTRRSPLDFPIEWERPKPGRRPDIFPQFAPLKTPLPIPMPADPPEEDEEEEEKKEEEEEEDPEKENPDNPEKQ